MKWTHINTYSLIDSGRCVCVSINVVEQEFIGFLILQIRISGWKPYVPALPITASFDLFYDPVCPCIWPLVYI